MQYARLHLIQKKISLINKQKNKPRKIGNLWKIYDHKIVRNISIKQPKKQHLLHQMKFDWKNCNPKIVYIETVYSETHRIFAPHSLPRKIEITHVQYIVYIQISGAITPLLFEIILVLTLFRVKASPLYKDNTTYNLNVYNIFNSLAPLILQFNFWNEKEIMYTITVHIQHLPYFKGFQHE